MMVVLIFMTLIVSIISAWFLDSESSFDAEPELEEQQSALNVRRRIVEEREVIEEIE